MKLVAMHRYRAKLKHLAVAGGSVVMSLALVLGLSGGARVAAAASQTSRADMFAAAAKEFGVPVNVLLAVSYNQSRWESNTGVSADGGYGLMDLRTYTPPTTSGRDGSDMPASSKKSANYYTLDRAAQLLGVAPDTLKKDDQQNIRGAAAVLAQDARRLNGNMPPPNIDSWYAAVAEFSGAEATDTAGSFADDVFATIKDGVSRVTTDGQLLNLPATASVQPNRGGLSALGLQASPNALPGQNPQCPPTLNCRFIAAAYAQYDPTNPAKYGNFDYAHRPADMQIRYIYIHDTEGSYESAISHFQDPTAQTSANYVIRSSDGAITQMVPNEDVAWGVGNWNMNMHGISIEHEGKAADGAAWYTEAMYKSSATLTRWLAAKYHIPLDRQHIIGHNDIMRGVAGTQAVQHWDPGPYWDWNHYMDLLRGNHDNADTLSAAELSAAPKVGQVITVSPHFATNQPVVTDCQTGTCVTLPKQGANFVYLRTQPSDNAPLISDPYLHPDNAPGTTRDDDWGDTAASGAKYVVAAVQGDWVGVWFAGQVGWFFNPHGAGHTAQRSKSQVVTPRPGLSSAAVYTGAYPEASAYPATIPVQPLNNAYAIPAGQQYTTTGSKISPDYFYDATINYSLPDDHAIVRGQQLYYQISFNHHIGFVKADDVVITR